MVVLPVPPLPATAMVMVMVFRPFDRYGWPPRALALPTLVVSSSALTEGKASRSVCGRKRAEVYSSMKLLSARELQVGHLGGDVEDVVAACSTQQERGVGAQGAGVAQEVEALQRQVGQQADLDGLLDVDVLAEGAADEYLLDVGQVDARRSRQSTEKPA